MSEREFRLGREVGEALADRRRELARERDQLLRRGLGTPGLFAVVYSTVGFSIYFSIGIVADRGLGLTPLLFLVSGLLFALTSLTYMEGASMLGERGGSSTFARHAFNELWSFVAGWAILLDFAIIIALAAISVPHYLGRVSNQFTADGLELVTAAAVIAFVAALNVIGVTGRRRRGWLIWLALGDLALQAVVIGVGLVVVLDPGALTAELDLLSSPGLEDIVYALVLTTVAYAGIEAASNLAPDIHTSRRALRRTLASGAVIVPLTYAGMAAVALMAVPVVPTPGGPETALTGPFLEAPVLGVVESYEPAWLGELLSLPVAIVATLVLVWAANTGMLGVSRLTYVMATNRQLPTGVAKLTGRWATPHVAIVGFALLALGFAIPTDVEMLAGVYAFGITLAITIAHLSVIRLRVTRPDARRPFRIPLDVGWRGWTLPLPAIAGAVIGAVAFASVVLLHPGARAVGGIWLGLGALTYAGYRLSQGMGLTERVSVPAEELARAKPTAQYGSILVPVFGSTLDDDIVSTAGRLATAEQDPREGGAMLEVLYVIPVPLSLPLEAKLSQAQLEEAKRVLDRAKEVGEEYDAVEVATGMVRARSLGSGIVREAARRGVEVIVMGGERPTRVKGGARYGGGAESRPAEVGPVTEYVLRRAPCRVLLTAPPEEAAPARPGDASG